MGLSSNQIEIVESNIQNDYISSNQDIYYNNNKIFGLYVYDEASGLNVTTNSSWEQIHPTDRNYLTIQEKEENYNSMSILEHVLWDSELRNYKTIMLAGLDISESMYKNASLALRYYLTSGEEGKTDYEYFYEEDIYTTGHKMREISFATAINESTEMKEKLKNNANAVMNIVEKLGIDENTPITFYNIIEDSGEVKNSNSDWYLTLHYYRIKIQGTVTKEENDYHLEMRYGLVDYYDWESNTAEGYGQLFKDCEEIKENSGGYLLDTMIPYLELMHEAGIARNYTNYGEVSYIITWNKEERESTGLYNIEQLENN